MTTLANAYGLIAVDKQVSNVLFLDADSYVVQQRLNGFPPRPHELVIAAAKGKAYVPLYGDGVHGDNPHPGHKIAVIDLARRTLRGFIDISPLQSPHTGRIGDDGRLYLCCENSRAIVVIDTDDDRVVERIATPSANTHRLTITPSGKKLFTENEEEASITVVDIAASPRHPYVVATAADRPALYIVDSDSHQLRGTLALNDHHHNAQVVRFNHDGSLLAVVGDGEPVMTLLDGELTPLASLRVGNKPMDGCFSPDNALLLIANEDDGTLSAIDLHLLQVIATPRVGEGCEVLGYFPLADA
ncbi:YncE family protein [Sodalis sp.]|uniref:YncE family protein n=1 Tax=Sodalis sp. (in: enterobacteria) TaxID=1898979 RepID=UPI00387302E5